MLLIREIIPAERGHISQFMKGLLVDYEVEVKMVDTLNEAKWMV